MIINSGVSEFIKRSLTSALLLLCFGGAYLHSSTLFCFFLLTVFILIVITELPKLMPTNNWFGYGIIALVYPGLPIGCLLWLTLNFRASDIFLPLYPFFIAWSADTCGYLVGKACGKHKITPTLSPGKTWEGLMGSLLGIIAVQFILIPRITIFSTTFFATPFFLLVSAIPLTIIAFLGGTFVSYLKRKQGLKDTGSLLPGHGGLLDRFDGVFFIAVVTVLLVWVV